MTRIPQINFSKGEIGPQLYARFDVDAYKSAVKEATNVLVLKYGGLDKRPGTRLVAEVLDPTRPTRLIPFSYSIEQSYALEMGHGYASPCAFGGRLVEEELEITAISADTEAQITALFHGYEVGDTVYLSGIEGEMGSLLNGRYWAVQSAVDEDNFTVNADTTGLVFTAATGGITRTETPVAPTPPTIPAVPDDPDPPVTNPGGGYGGGGNGDFDLVYY